MYNIYTVHNQILDFTFIYMIILIDIVWLKPCDLDFKKHCMYL